MTIRLPGVCQDCRRPVHWNGVRWINSKRNGEPTQPGEGRHHHCLTRCNAYMPRANDRCGRKPHDDTHRHRSRYAMANECRAKGFRRGAEAANIMSGSGW